jgi:hypothetical protein
MQYRLDLHRPADPGIDGEIMTGYPSLSKPAAHGFSPTRFRDREKAVVPTFRRGEKKEAIQND